jgi:hypothetical protein
MKYRLIVVAIALALVGQASAVPVVVVAHPVIVAHPVVAAHPTVASHTVAPVVRTVVTPRPATFTPRAVPIVVAPAHTTSSPVKKCDKRAKDCK